MLTLFADVLNRSDTWLSTFSRSRSLSTPRRPVGATVRCARPGAGGSKILYVPVTRKVSLTDETNQQKMHSGMIQK
jgi:hypothetical protein